MHFDDYLADRCFDLLLVRLHAWFVAWLFVWLIVWLLVLLLVWPLVWSLVWLLVWWLVCALVFCCWLFICAARLAAH